MDNVRRKTRVIDAGGVKIGGHYPVSIQSMTKVKTSGVSACVRQIKDLEKAGCEIVRVAVKDTEDACAISRITRKINIPLVADIHFDYRLALISIENGADKIRVNPGNLSDRGQILAVIKSAKKRKIPIRIGLNSGSIKGRLSAKSGPAGTGRTEELFVKTALDYVEIFEKNRFRNIAISVKSSDVGQTVRSYRALSAACDYPLHLGVTAAGSYDTGIVKSSMGIGALLLDGIGDTIRVSLTGDPVPEVLAAKKILQSAGLRSFGPEIISCPTCGRCQVDLAGIVAGLERELSACSYQPSAPAPVKIAVMGCEVNGPGEAKGADIGIAFGKNAGMIFKSGKIIKKVAVKSAIRELLHLMKEHQA